MLNSLVEEQQYGSIPVCALYIYIYNIHMYICITFPAIIEYGIKILASPGIPGIELENRYLKTDTENTVEVKNTILRIWLTIYGCTKASRAKTK